MTGVIFLDANFAPVSAPVDNFTSLVWSSRYYQHGSFSLTLPASKYAAVKSAVYVYNPDNGGCAILSRIKLLSQNGTVTLGGYLLEALFDKRRVTADTKLNGTLETVIRALVTANAITSPRTVDSLTLGTAIGYTDTTDSAIEAGTKLSDALYTTLKPFGMSYSITLDYAAGTLVFNLVKGLDRTQAQTVNPWATFSTSFENLQNYEYTHNDDDYANFAYVIANDAVLGAVTVEVDQSGTEERRETTVQTSVTSKKSDDTDMTLAEYQAVLASIGAEALYDSKAIDDVTGNIDTAGSLVYHINYNLGDWCDVSAVDAGLSWVTQVTAVDEVYEGGSVRIVPSFGESIENLRGIIRKEIKKNIGGVSVSAGSGATANSIVITEVNASKRITKVDVSSFTEILPYQFYNFNDTAGIYCYLIDVTMSNGITSIGAYAFYGCINLALTLLPSGIISIGTYAFYGCDNLALTSLPSGLTSIAASAFGSCAKLALTSLPSGVTSVGSSAFYGCIKLALTSLSSGLTSIATSAFYGCTTLRKIWIPISCITISASSTSTMPFRSCSALLVLYCEIAAKPGGWGTYWNYYNSTTVLTTNWGVTKEAFDAL